MTDMKKFILALTTIAALTFGGMAVANASNYNNNCYVNSHGATECYANGYVPRTNNHYSHNNYNSHYGYTQPKKYTVTYKYNYKPYHGYTNRYNNNYYHANYNNSHYLAKTHYNAGYKYGYKVGYKTAKNKYGYGYYPSSSRHTRGTYGNNYNNNHNNYYAATSYRYQQPTYYSKTVKYTYKAPTPKYYNSYKGPATNYYGYYRYQQPKTYYKTSYNNYHKYNSNSYNHYNYNNNYNNGCGWSNGYQYCH